MGRWTVVGVDFGGGVELLISGDTPLQINMEHNHGGLEDHFPF